LTDEAANHEKRICGITYDLNTEFNGWRMVLVLLPLQIGIDVLVRISENNFDLVLRDRHIYHLFRKPKAARRREGAVHG
jgi:hypothetical protein